MKTKAILSSLLVCIVTTLSAQINLNDSTVQVVAYWSKGDSYDYLYDYYKYNIQGKDTISWERHHIVGKNHIQDKYYGYRLYRKQLYATSCL